MSPSPLSFFKSVVSEGKTPHQHPLPRLKVEDAAESRGSRGVDSAEARGCIAVGQINLLELGVGERSARGVAPKRTIENVGELHPQIEAVALFDAPGTADIHVLARTALKAVVVVVRG